MKEKKPSAITGLKLNRATFNDVSAEGLTWINFFYGNNGAGKSSIANAIQADDGVIWADGHSAADYDILVYNQAFIDRNFTAYDNLKGVFTVNEANISIQREVEQRKAEKKRLSDAYAAVSEEYAAKTAAKSALLAAFQAECWTRTADLRTGFAKALDGKKQKKSFADAILGEQNPTEHSLAQLKALYDIAFDSSARTYPEFQKVGTSATYASLPGKELLDKVIVSSSATPFAQFMKAIHATDWVRQGHAHYAGAAEGRCPYCQRTLPETFEKDLASCFDAQYQRDIRSLGQFQATYERETAEIVRALRRNLNCTMPSLQPEEYLSRVALLEKSFAVNAQKISEKLREPTRVVSLEDTDILLVEIGSLIDGINRQIRANNDVVNRKKASVKKCKTEIVQYLAFLLQATVQKYHADNSSLDSELAALTVRGQQLRKDIRTLSAEIAGLHAQMVSTEAAISHINHILSDSGFQGFHLRAKEGVANTYEIVRENGALAENLSEGERNFLAFLYFYHQVRGSMRSDAVREKIVVIDDPVSGMDSTALFLVSALVRKMIHLCRNRTESQAPGAPDAHIRQLFVLTHNVYFHREVTCKLVGDYDCVSFYIIRKTGNASAVQLCQRRKLPLSTELENYNPVQSSYAALWEELREIHSAIPARNVMRRILEYYFLRLCGYDGSDLRELVLVNNREKFIRQTENGEVDRTDYQLASSLLTDLNQPHGIDEGLNYVADCEDAAAYRRVFQMIFEVLGQGQHFHMMTTGSAPF